MPFHRVPAHSIHEDLRAIEHDGERVVSATLKDGFYHIFTSYDVEWVERRIGGDE